MIVGVAVPGRGASVIAWSGAVAFATALGWFLYSYAFRWGAPVAPGPLAAPILTNIGLFSAFALHHSIFARSGLKAWIRRQIPEPLERSLYTWTSTALFAMVCAAWQDVPGMLYRLEGPPALIGYGAQLAGVVLTLVAGRNMDFLDLAGVRQVQAARRGTPPAHVALQTRGLYGLVRHPLYFAWVLLVFGAPAMTATRATFAVVSTLYLAVAIPLEERGLDQLFGPAYEDYRRQVRWRMLPFLY